MGSLTWWWEWVRVSVMTLVLAAGSLVGVPARARGHPLIIWRLWQRVSGAGIGSVSKIGICQRCAAGTISILSGAVLCNLSPGSVVMKDSGYVSASSVQELYKHSWDTRGRASSLRQ